MITGFEASTSIEAKYVAAKDILAVLARAVEDIAEGLGMRMAEAVKWLSFLEASGMVEVVYQDGRRFHVAAYY